MNLHVDLVYAPNKTKVEVEALKKEPVEWQTVVDPDPDFVKLSIRIKVLSSQVQNSLFRLHITASDSAAETTLEGFSDPIKVVSKPDQIRKKRAAVGEPDLEVPTSKRRARGEEILEQISSARDIQEKNLAVLQQVLDSSAAPLSSDAVIANALTIIFSELSSAPQGQAQNVLQAAIDSLPEHVTSSLTTLLLPALKQLDDSGH